MRVQASGRVRVAVIREEGSNGDREMAAAVYSGGMEPWDVTMSDLLNARASLDSFQGKPTVPQKSTVHQTVYKQLNNARQRIAILDCNICMLLQAPGLPRPNCCRLECFLHNG